MPQNQLLFHQFGIFLVLGQSKSCPLCQMWSTVSHGLLISVMTFPSLSMAETGNDFGGNCFDNETTDNSGVLCGHGTKTESR